MYYDFSKTLLATQEDLHDFIHLHTTCVDHGKDDVIKSVTALYQKIFFIFQTKFDSEDVIALFEELAELKMQNGVPHTILSNEIYKLKGLLIENLQGEDIDLSIKELFLLFKDITNRVSHLYLNEYIEILISSNNVRLSSISDLVEKNIILHYEAHLEWLISLARHIHNQDKENFPQLDQKCCSFGKWLYNEGRGLIQNHSKFTNLERIHARLHFFAKKYMRLLIHKSIMHL